MYELAEYSETAKQVLLNLNLNFPPLLVLCESCRASASPTTAVIQKTGGRFQKLKSFHFR